MANDTVSGHNNDKINDTVSGHLQIWCQGDFFLKKIVAEGGDQLPSVILLFYLLIVLFLFILSGKLGKSDFH